MIFLRVKALPQELNTDVDGDNLHADPSLWERKATTNLAKHVAADEGRIAARSKEGKAIQQPSVRLRLHRPC
jgi:hypothetical protein